MQDETGDILVRAAAAPSVRSGDRLEAVGVPATGGYSTVLDDALLRVGKDGLWRRAWRRRRCPVTTERRWIRDCNSFRGGWNAARTRH